MKKSINYFLLSALIFLPSCTNTDISSNNSTSHYEASELDPYISFNGPQTLKYRNDDAFEMPSYECFDGNDRLLDNSNLVIEHYFNDELIDQDYISGTISEGVYERGKHNFHFTLTDPYNSKTYEDDVFLEIYQRIFYDGGDTIDGELFNEETEPYYVTQNEGWGIRPFYLERSYQYYAEATFSGFEGGFRGIGMVHATKEDINLGSFIRDEIDANTVDDWWQYNQGYMWETHYNADYSWFTQGPSALFGKNEVLFGEGKENVVACARDYDDFYFFLNGKLINKYTYDDYKYIKTLPGLLFASYGQNENINRTTEYDAKNFNFYNGSKAIDKLSSLLESPSNNKTFNYLRYDDLENDNWAIFFEDDEEYGAGFEYSKGTMLTGGDWYNDTISPNVHFIGEYEFEFDFEVLSINTNFGYANWRMSINDARFSDNNSKTELLPQHSGMLLSYGVSNSLNNDSYISNHKYEQGIVNSFSVKDMKEKLNLGRGRDKFHVTVKLNIDYLNKEEHYTYSFSNQNGEYEVNFITSDQETLDRIRPVYIYFASRGMNYRVSNFDYRSIGSLDY